MHYLSTTDEEAAQLRVDAERAEFKAKAMKDAIFMHREGTVAERTAYAGSAPEYLTAMSEYFDALRASDYVRNKRQTETLVVEVWRSINANRRQAA